MHLITVSTVFALASFASASVLPRQQAPTTTTPLACTGSSKDPSACPTATYGKLRGGAGKCITQAAGPNNNPTSFCAIDSCPFSQGLLQISATALESVKYNACVQCGEDQAFKYEGNSACRDYVAGGAFTFDCVRVDSTDAVNTACDKGTVSAGAARGLGRCVVGPVPVDPSWAAGKDFSKDTNSRGPGYCAYTACKTGYVLTGNVFRLGATNFMTCLPQSSH